MAHAQTERVLITNARVFTGTGEEVIEDGAVLVSGRYIDSVGTSEQLKDVPEGTRVIDARGRFVMPGMTESHAHLSYTNQYVLDQTPVEQSMMHTIDNARLMLGSGFTSAISFGGVHKCDVFLRNGINAGIIPGPRLVASGRDLGAVSSIPDTVPDHLRRMDEGLGTITTGPWEIRKAVRSIRKNGGDVVKLFLDGEGIASRARPDELTYTDEEVIAGVDEAHRHGLRVVVHSRSADAVKQAMRAGVDIIGHGNFLDDEALEILREARHRIFVGPAIAWEVAFLERPEEVGQTREIAEARGYVQEVEATILSVKRLKEAGVPVLVGGDYGLNITPHGTYAKDLEYFVNLFGYTPFETLLAATRDGGRAADPTGMVGTLEAGKYADLVVVDGDPLTDITVLQHHNKITAVMKDGVIYKDLTNNNPYLHTRNDFEPEPAPAVPVEREAEITRIGQLSGTDTPSQS